MGTREETRSTGARARAARTLTRAQVLGRRFVAQGLGAAQDGLAGDADWPSRLAVLDLGVQDTGPDGAAWALALRGAPLGPGGVTAPGELALVWSVRGAPHLYRRRELADVALALVPFSEADARKRVFDAAKPLVAAGIEVAEALAAVGHRMREIVTGPTAKADLSGRLTALMPEPYLRWCRPCQATHLYEMPFRLATLHAGLELEPGTSPPVLRRVPRWPVRHLDHLADLVATAPAQRGVPVHLDTVRACLRLLGPARPADVAGYLDAPVADVRRRWADLAEELVEVDVDGERRWDLADAPEPGDPRGTVRLLGPFDLFLQARDRDLLVPDAAARAGLWPVLGRPGAVVQDGEVVGTWRPRASGPRLRVLTEPWVPWSKALDAAVDVEAERLAAFRGVSYAGRAS